MMNEYQKRGAYTTVEEYVLAKTGESIEKLDHNRKYEVQGLNHAAAMLQLAKRRGTAIYLYTDSDLDGSGAMYIEGTLHLLQKLEPFGRGFEKPVFRMRVHVLPDQVRYLKKAGSDSEHLMLFLYNKFTAILFTKAKQYRQDGEPRELYLYGTITRNVRHGELVPQMITTDYEIVRG